MTSGQPATERATALPWFDTLVAGVVAGAGMGLLLHYQLFILRLFGLLYGQPTVASGVLVHAAASLAFAFLFAGAVTSPALRDVATHPTRITVFGVAYGVGLWAVVFGVALPLLTRTTPASALPLPYLPLDGLVAHLVYGLLLGGTFAVLWEPPPAGSSA